MKNFILLMTSLFAFAGMASSVYVDSAYLYDCGGKVELRKSDSNLHLKFKEVENCSNFLVQTSRYGRTLKQYKLNTNGNNAPYTASFTLSKSMWQELEKDAMVNLKIRSNSGYHEDNITLYVPRAKKHYNNNPRRCGGHSGTGFTGWALTNSCKCAYYQNGRFHHHAKPHQQYKCQ
jgi:hypothetical protein